MNAHFLSLGLAAKVAGVIFAGYCVYFDYKRTHHPDYKKKIKNSRLRKKYDNLELPDFDDYDQLHEYWDHEILLGEQLCKKRQYREGVQHFVNAVLLCQSATHILKVLHCTITSKSFEELLMCFLRSNPTYKINKSISERLEMIRRDILGSIDPKAQQFGYVTTETRMVNYESYSGQIDLTLDSSLWL